MTRTGEADSGRCHGYETSHATPYHSSSEGTGAPTDTAGAKPGIVGALPRGYDTTLGRHFEEGHQLSGGQWQKMALSRAFMRRAPVVVLDEPTAAIDAEAEAEIFGRLKDVARGATALVIAHRFSTVRMADRIVVMENGKVIEHGVHQDLLSAGGVYARLFRLQASGYLTEAASP